MAATSLAATASDGVLPAYDGRWDTVTSAQPSVHSCAVCVGVSGGGSACHVESFPGRCRLYARMVMDG